MQLNKCDSTIHIKEWETSGFSFKMLCIRLLFLFHLSFAFDWDEAREHQAQADRKKDYVLSRIDMSNFTVLNATAYKEVCGFRLYVPNWILFRLSMLQTGRSDHTTELCEWLHLLYVYEIIVIIARDYEKWSFFSFFPISHSNSVACTHIAGVATGVAVLPIVAHSHTSSKASIWADHLYFRTCKHVLISAFQCETRIRLCIPRTLSQARIAIADDNP